MEKSVHGTQAEDSRKFHDFVLSRSNGEGLIFLPKKDPLEFLRKSRGYEGMLVTIYGSS
jgi:hypothetical protein